ncbi:MAG: hypothetical protein NTX15_03045 [Candidatus Kapabacteria bacterium]|nr:hypothetical protein [Candidatus Kapabacteria bacterium]
MTEAGSLSPVSARSALHLASLLDLSTRAAEYDSAEPILNAALLSVMGRLKILRACVFRPVHNQFEPVLSKGLKAISVPTFELSGPAFAHETPGAEPLAKLGVHWLIPLHHQGRVTALICLGKTMDGVEDHPDVRTYIDLMRSILAIAMHNAETVLSLRQTTLEVERGAQLVRSLYEFSREFTGVMDKKSIIRLLSLRLMGQLMTSSFALLLQPDFGDESVIVNRKEAERLGELLPDVLALTEPVRTIDLLETDPLRLSFERFNVGMAQCARIHAC